MGKATAAGAGRGVPMSPDPSHPSRHPSLKEAQPVARPARGKADSIPPYLRAPALPCDCSNRLSPGHPHPACPRGQAQQPHAPRLSLSLRGGAAIERIRRHRAYSCLGSGRLGHPSQLGHDRGPHCRHSVLFSARGGRCQPSADHRLLRRREASAGWSEWLRGEFGFCSMAGPSATHAGRRRWSVPRGWEGSPEGRRVALRATCLPKDRSPVRRGAAASAMLALRREITSFSAGLFTSSVKVKP